MNYEKIISDIDDNISQYILNLMTNLEHINFDNVNCKTFILSQNFLADDLKIQKKVQGVYFFELNIESELLKGSKSYTKIKNFAHEWSKKQHNSFFSSSVIKSRLNAKVNFNDKWLPLYLGKSKDISKRINEHIHLSPDKNTYSMKLKHRTNLEGLEFRISILPINVKNYDFIVPHIERILREKHSPIIGKQ